MDGPNTGGRKAVKAKLQSRGRFVDSRAAWPEMLVRVRKGVLFVGCPNQVGLYLLVMIFTLYYV